MNRKKHPLAIAVLALASSLPEVSMAQSQIMLEEVLVTARKRLENLQDIPVSVTAFDAKAIERRDMRSLEDLAGNTTGLIYENYSTSGLSAAPVIRGMSLAFTTAREQNTAVFLDGIYLPRQSMLNPGLSDMERVEVVKGPQSALYGRNAFAGAINYVTKKPTDELDGYVGVVYGTDEREDYSGNISGPIIKDRLLGRISYSTSEFDGHTENDHPYADLEPGGDHTEGNLGGWDDETFSAQLTFLATDNLSIDLSYYHSELKREPQPFFNLDGARQNDGIKPENTLNCLDTTTNIRLGPITQQVSGNHAWCGKLPDQGPYREDLAALGYDGDMLVDPRSFALATDTDIWTARLDWDLSDAWNITYLFGYTEHDGAGTGVQGDAKSVVGDGIVSGFGITPEGGFGPLYENATTFNSNPEETLEASSHEIQLAWDGGGAWRARGGLYYTDVEDANWNVFWFVEPCDSAENCSTNPTKSPPVVESTFPPWVGHGQRGNFNEYEDKIYAAFGEVSWDVNDKFSLGLEARYTKEEKEFEQFTSAFGIEDPLVGDEDFDYFTPRFTAQYRFNDDSMAYTTIGKGVKTGGFNSIDPAINPDQAVFDEEENWSFEVGSKNMFFSGSLMLNVAAYYIQWSDQQATESANDPNPFAVDVVGNVGDVDIYGLELETVYRFADNWFIDAGYTYSDPEFDDAIYSPAVNDTNSSFGCDDITCPSDGDVSGNMLARSSKQQAFAGLNYQTTFADWNFNARLDANYRSKMYATPLNLGHNGSRTIANMSLNLSNENWDFTLWGKNIFDEEYAANTFVLPSFSGYLVGLGPRDTWGLSARYNF